MLRRGRTHARASSARPTARGAQSTDRSGAGPAVAAYRRRTASDRLGHRVAIHHGIPPHRACWRIVESPWAPVAGYVSALRLGQLTARRSASKRASHGCAMPAISCNPGSRTPLQSTPGYSPSPLAASTAPRGTHTSTLAASSTSASLAISASSTCGIARIALSTFWAFRSCRWRACVRAHAHACACACRRVRVHARQGACTRAHLRA
jgi:hypothetical protein